MCDETSNYALDFLIWHVKLLRRILPDVQTHLVWSAFDVTFSPSRKSTEGHCTQAVADLDGLTVPFGHDSHSIVSRLMPWPGPHALQPGDPGAHPDRQKELP